MQFIYPILQPSICNLSVFSKKMSPAQPFSNAWRLKREESAQSEGSHLLVARQLLPFHISFGSNIFSPVFSQFFRRDGRGVLGQINGRHGPTRTNNCYVMKKHSCSDHQRLNMSNLLSS